MERATTRKGTVGWLVPESERHRLLSMFAPAYADVVAHHVTWRGGVAEDHPLPSAQAASVVGLADDGRGVQALVVEIDGTTDRPDGSTWHITWSLDRAAGRRAVQSNDVIRDCGWKKIEPVPIRIAPSFFVPGD